MSSSRWLGIVSALIVAVACSSGAREQADGPEAKDDAAAAGTHVGEPCEPGKEECGDLVCVGGAGCPGQWSCQRIECDQDRRVYCGCDGQYFYGSGNCAGRYFEHAGDCEP